MSKNKLTQKIGGYTIYDILQSTIIRISSRGEYDLDTAPRPRRIYYPHPQTSYVVYRISSDTRRWSP